jgi:hypothetical protein
MKHSLNFTIGLAASNDLIYGTLKLTYPDKNFIDYLATSGCAQWQQPGDEWARGKGPIPAGFEYKIPTTPYWLPTRGIEGYFFHIQPDPVSDSGNTRSELGIHFDANAPGSAGCIVLKNLSGIKSIPLSVKYT